MKKDIKGIAYGVSDFEKIQRRNKYYVDKTHFIPLLEENDYIFFIRPRRFGKSLWLSILETYYDVAKKEQFDQFFADTWIGKNPTEEQGSYQVLTFNFSMVRAQSDLVEESFEAYGEIKIDGFLSKYEDFFPQKEADLIRSKKNVSQKLAALFDVVPKLSLNLYILIDEYDNFANTILSTAGEKAYHDLTHGDGFYRHFFAVLKGGAGGSGSGVNRLFITGVSPVTMDDVTSGFNIGSNLSLDVRLNGFTGFTKPEVEAMLSYYQNKGLFLQNVSESIGLMELWYNNYRFSLGAKEVMFNTDMVIYFIQKSNQNGLPPDQLIDQNIRIDYSKLRHLMLINKKLNGNFDHLKTILEDGEISSRIKDSFPLEHVTLSENFISLLYYFGLLTFAGMKRGRPVLTVPNQTVGHLMYEYIREAYRDAKTFSVDLDRLDDLLSRMAYDGEWENFIDFLADAIKDQTSIRDYLSAEKVIQGFLLAYLNISDFYISRTEREFNKGFADIVLEPFLARYPDLPHAYLIELKYIKRSEFSQAALKEKVEEAEAQLVHYLQDDLLQKQQAFIKTTGLVLVFNGWELVYRQSC